MTVQLVAPKESFHPSLIDSAQEKFQYYDSRATYYKRIATITIIATGAIGLSVLFLTFFISMATPLPLVVFGLTLTLPFLGVYHKNCIQKSFNYAHKAEIERGVLQELEKFKDHTCEQIETLLLDVGIEKEKIPLDLLRKLNPEEPLKALIPVIARIRYFVFRSIQIKEKAYEMIFQKDVSAKTALRLRKQAWSLLERDAIPALFEAAFLHHVLTHPDTKMKLSSLGKIQAQSLAGRLSLNFFDNKDPYFVFEGEEKRTLEFNSVKNLVPQDLHEMLFAKA